MPHIRNRFVYIRNIRLELNGRFFRYTHESEEYLTVNLISGA